MTTNTTHRQLVLVGLGVRVAAVSLGYRALTSDAGATDPAIQQLRTQMQVWGMRTDEGRQGVTYEGETYHFCSRACRRTSEETPGEFATVDPTVSDGHDHH